MLGSAYPYVDAYTVSIFQGRSPKYSTADRLYLQNRFNDKIAFSWVTDEGQRAGILQRCCQVNHMIPSIWTFLEDTKWLEPASKVIRSILPLGTRSTIRYTLRKYYSGSEEQFSNHYRNFWIHCLKHFPELGMVQPRRESRKFSSLQLSPPDEAWIELITFSRTCGFHTPAIINSGVTSLPEEPTVSVQPRPRIAVPNSQKFDIRHRCGRMFELAHKSNQTNLNLEAIYHTFTEDDVDNHITAFAVSRDTFRAFFGFQIDSNLEIISDPDWEMLPPRQISSETMTNIQRESCTYAEPLTEPEVSREETSTAQNDEGGVGDPENITMLDHSTAENTASGESALQEPNSRQGDGPQLEEANLPMADLSAIGGIGSHSSQLQVLTSAATTSTSEAQPIEMLQSYAQQQDMDDLFDGDPEEDIDAQDSGTPPRPEQVVSPGAAPAQALVDTVGRSIEKRRISYVDISDNPEIPRRQVTSALLLSQIATGLLQKFSEQEHGVHRITILKDDKGHKISFYAACEGGIQLYNSDLEALMQSDCQEYVVHFTRSQDGIILRIPSGNSDPIIRYFVSRHVLTTTRLQIPQKLELDFNVTLWYQKEQVWQLVPERRKTTKLRKSSQGIEAFAQSLPDSAPESDPVP